MPGFYRGPLLILIAFATVAAADEVPLFEIVTKRTEDRVEVKSVKEKSVLSIFSEAGVGHALIKRNEDKWPDTILLRFHLRGLEHFDITNGKVKLSGAVSSQDWSTRVWRDDRETMLLDSHSPYWMEIQIVDREGRPTATDVGKLRYVELSLPTAFLEDNPDSIQINWIDFYRN